MVYPSKQNATIMKIFQVWPKHTRSSNGQVITPAMLVTVTLPYHAPSPFSHGIKEVAEAYMRIYKCDIRKLSCSSSDFNYKGLA